MYTTQAIKHLIIANVIFFLLAQILPPFSNVVALWFVKNPNFHSWQLFSHMFMHGGVAHLFFNMYALWAFGAPLEGRWGWRRFMFFYFACGVGAALIYMGVNIDQFQHQAHRLIAAGVAPEQLSSLLAEGKYDSQWAELIGRADLDKMLRLYMTPAVGASGAIYGVLVAFAMLYPNAKLMLLFFPVPIKAKYFIPVLILMDLFSGVTGFSIFGGNIAHFAHVGGAVIGFVLMWVWRGKGNNHYTDYQRYA